ncbi:hypothetical protein P8452_21429 [Trifolium repens]|nr:hypothetical protein P8452_21429 [Trifolium repens]
MQKQTLSLRGRYRRRKNQGTEGEETEYEEDSKFSLEGREATEEKEERRMRQGKIRTIFSTTPISCSTSNSMRFQSNSSKTSSSNWRMLSVLIGAL